MGIVFSCEHCCNFSNGFDCDTCTNQDKFSNVAKPNLNAVLADGSKFNIKELLTEYTQYLYDCNYLDDDWWCEDPGSVEAFLKEKFGNVS